MKVLVTGATGFVGLALISRLVDLGRFNVKGAVRRESNKLPAKVDQIVTGDLTPSMDWRQMLVGVDVVVHLAARVHVMTDTAIDPLTEFRQVNVEGTMNLARQAVASGVHRFVLISSIKVNGEGTRSGQPFGTEDVPAPKDPYGISKHEAELGLCQLAGMSGLEVVIIRPPLVYGPGVKANFRSMMCWLKRGVPMPLGAINNKRSLVGLFNLVDLIVTCLDHPAAANQTFLAGDGEDLSTTELLKRMALALERPAHLIPVPTSLLKVVAILLGRRDMAQRLCGSLQVDISKTRTLLGWNPPITVDEELQRTAKGFLNETTI